MELLLLLFVVCGLLITAADGNSPVVVKEDSDVVLPCSLSSKENIESKLFDWKKDGHMEVFMYNGGQIYSKDSATQDKQFKGRVSHFGDELKNGNASIKITKATVSDSGIYSCDFPHLQPSQTFNIQLVVKCILKDRTAENCSGACRTPSAKTIEASDDRSVLQCVVGGASPRPKVEWRDSSGQILPAEETGVTGKENSVNIILRTTVTKTGIYSCVVTQEGICHEAIDEVAVLIPVSEFPTGLTVTAAVFCLLFLVVSVLLVLSTTGRINCKKDEEKRETIKETESGLLPA
ncbi:butyrophilin subfamily 2 member A2-like isoform X1 [Xyrichtys novacula]|uniref:Butyrophilin subfamily 2 member A2-like isoform X1 n=1 Tax=Xyrichtys novacula TaxID=13765 RepID=A0AAV1ER56_XYRNO|nr:butyrophilin subfamily 2 member A2-like isoform X1 [Xyrichtys novacula]